MPAAVVFWPVLLGLSVLVAGLVTYRRDRRETTIRDAFGLAAFGPVFVAASLAAFAGEHFAAGPSLAQLVPKWLPARLFIAYCVGVAHLAAATSFVAKRYVRAAALCLSVMFALFVLLMDLPGSIAHPASRISWILVARETTFAIGALALFATVSRNRSPARSRTLSEIGRIWTASVLVYYGIDHLLHPQFSPGVPGTMATAAWVPAPHAVAYVSGLLLVLFGIAMFAARLAQAGAALSGTLLILLTLVLYVPQFFLAGDVSQRVIAYNYVFDTLLFAGTLLVICRAIEPLETSGVASPHRLMTTDSGVRATTS